MSTTNSYDGVVLRRIETDSDMFMCLDGIVLLCRRWKEGMSAVGNGVESCWRCCKGRNPPPTRDIECIFGLDPVPTKNKLCGLWSRAATIAPPLQVLT